MYLLMAVYAIRIAIVALYAGYIPPVYTPVV